jgi:hypothetical protein
MKYRILFIVLSYVFTSYGQNIEIIPNEVYRTEFTFFETPLVFEKGEIEHHEGPSFLWEDAFNVFYNPFYLNSIDESISLSQNMTKENYLNFKNRSNLEKVQSLNRIYILGFYELLFKQNNHKILVIINTIPDSKQKLKNSEFRTKFDSTTGGTNFFIYNSQKQKYLNYSTDDFLNISVPYISSKKFKNFLIGTPNRLEECYLIEGGNLIKNHNPLLIMDKRVKKGNMLTKDVLLDWLKNE